MISVGAPHAPQNPKGVTINSIGEPVVDYPGLKNALSGNAAYNEQKPRTFANPQDVVGHHFDIFKWKQNGRNGGEFYQLHNGYSLEYPPYQHGTNQYYLYLYDPSNAAISRWYVVEVTFD